MFAFWRLWNFSSHTLLSTCTHAYFSERSEQKKFHAFLKATLTCNKIKDVLFFKTLGKHVKCSHQNRLILRFSWLFMVLKEQHRPFDQWNTLLKKVLDVFYLLSKFYVLTPTGSKVTGAIEFAKCLPNIWSVGVSPSV